MLTSGSASVRRRLRHVVVGFLGILAALGIIAVGTPAQAHPGWYIDCAHLAYSPYYNCVEWTGGWPSGYVRAEIGGTYGVKLRECHSAGCQASSNSSSPVVWNDVAVAYATSQGNPVVTPSVRVGKYSAYQSCYQTVPGGVWNCAPLRWYVYLGDG